MSEVVTDSTTRVLEIGYGVHPACEEGWLFNDSSVQYVGLELPTDFRGSFLRLLPTAPDVSAVTASMHALPFADASFRYVLMRSVFGQFRSMPEIVRPVRLGIYECFRVLKNDGQIIIAEENTPEPRSYVGSILEDAGFVVESTHVMPDKWDAIDAGDDWFVGRSKFYDGSPAQEGSPDDPGSPYLMIASKPSGLVLEGFTSMVCTNFYRRGAEPKFQEVTYQRPKVPS